MRMGEVMHCCILLGNFCVGLTGDCDAEDDDVFLLRRGGLHHFAFGSKKSGRGEGLRAEHCRALRYYSAVSILWVGGARR